MLDIFMAPYNGEKYLKEQIDSILNQTYKDWRLLVRDDGSTDRTVAIINEYVSRYKDKIILIEDNINAGGAKYNFFEIMKRSSSDYIMFADQDDVWERDKVSHAYNYIVRAEKKNGTHIPLLLYSDLKVADSSLKIMDTSMFRMQKLDRSKIRFKDYLVQNNATGCTVIFNRELRELCSVMPSAAIMHDWWLALIAAAFGRVYYMASKDILYRQHGNNTEGAKNLKSLTYLLKRVFGRSEIKKNLMDTYSQAEAFGAVFGSKLNRENKEILSAYISLKNSKKLKKYSIIKKWGFMKSGLARKIGYYMYI